MNDELVVRNSLWKLPLFILPCAGFLLVALFGPEAFGLRPKAGWELIRWPTVLGMAFLIVMIARQLFDRRPQIVLGSSGVYLRRWSEATIPWEAVTQVRVEREYYSLFAFRRYLSFQLRDPKAYLRTAKWARFPGAGTGSLVGDVTTTVVGYEYAIEDLWEAVERYAPEPVELDGSKLGGPGEGLGSRRKRG